MARRNRLTLALGSLAVLAATGCGPMFSSNAAASPYETEGRSLSAGRPPLASVDSGALRGVALAKTLSFKGIPYAAPPVGDLRFRPPAPVAPWRGVRDATQFGAKCPQPPSQAGVGFGNEDCLTLNVWSPRTARPASGWPVMVFVHGGFFTLGSSAERVESHDAYDGAVLAEHGQAVVVTLNYRLGALGFLAHSALARESPHAATGNYGDLDQLAALQWVQRNILAFGGDPKRVMLFGQSAGAFGVCDLLASPLARGLFSRAILESGGCNVAPRAAAEAQGDEVATALGCNDPRAVLACLRSKPAAALAGVKAPSSAPGSFAWGPTVDGYFLTTTPMDAFLAGKHNAVPLVLSVNASEFATLWTAAYPAVPPPKDEVEYRSAVHKIFGDKHADQLLAAYPSSHYPSPAHAAAMMAADVWFNCPNRATARAIAAHQAAPVRRMVFAHTFDSGPLKSLGAGHGVELLYLFRTWPLSWWTPTPREVALSDAMIGDWARFAAFGDPNTPGAPPWPRYDAASDSFLRMDTGIALGAGFRRAECDLIDTLR